MTKREQLIKQEIQRLMNKLKLFGIVSKRWHKYSSYRGTQGPIKLDLIKRSFSAVYPNHKCIQI